MDGTPVNWATVDQAETIPTHSDTIFSAPKVRGGACYSLLGLALRLLNSSSAGASSGAIRNAPFGHRGPACGRLSEVLEDGPQNRSRPAMQSARRLRGFRSRAPRMALGGPVGVATG